MDDYFRRDQRQGITPPNLLKDFTFAEHITRARGKRSQFTSITLDPEKCRDMGETTYRLRRPDVDEEGHLVVDHEDLISALNAAVREGDRLEKLRATAAKRYALRRKEGLVDWKFDISGIAKKEVIGWAQEHVRPFFQRLG